jgi:XTP/dITP diphosphohydrolase
MKELLVATGNRGKFLEIEAMLGADVERFYSLEDFPGIPKVEEDGATFAENALKKGRAAAVATGKAVIADDSGLEVDILGGRPGVYSARFAGENAPDSANNEKLINEIVQFPEEQRIAAFRCVIALCLPDGSCRTFTGSLEGIIIPEARGGGGFGYDPHFLVPQYGKTLAELPLDVKNAISHRGKALTLLKEYLAGL